MRCVLIVAQSLDGFITRHDAPGAGWASAADQCWFRDALADFDCSVMGRVTYASARTQIRAAGNNGRQRVIVTRNPTALAADTVPGSIHFTAAAPPAILAELAAAGRHRCALLGGAQIHDAFLAAGVVDELWVTIEPRLFGAGTPIVHARQDRRLRLIGHTRLDDSDSIVLRYAITPSP